ncbi:AI-2E family transporter [uncultured archaeon]|nr:AI-2E family transporter [uncultured archaeon]
MVMDSEYFKKVITTVLIVGLIILSLFIIKPIFIAVIAGILLAFIFNPLYELIFKLTKSRNISAGLVCLFLFLLIFIPFWFLTPMIVDETFKIYLAAQKIDFAALLQSIFPSIFHSQAFAAQVSSITSSFISKTMNSILNGFSDLILDLPNVLLQLLVVAFTFFFVLRDKNEILDYIRGLLPFSKEVEKKIFESSKDITYSVLYGHVVIGLLQGVIVGISFLIFSVPNALFLTLLACVAAVIPVLGAPFVWIPVAVYLFIAGNNGAAWAIVGFGLFAGIIDNILRPLIVSKRTKISTLLITLGMVGGLLFLGILGLIIGPLILAYLLIILEIYRDKNSVGGITSSTN